VKTADHLFAHDTILRKAFLEVLDPADAERFEETNAQTVADFFGIFSRLDQSRRYRELSQEAAHVEGQAKIRRSLTAKWNRKDRFGFRIPIVVRSRYSWLSMERNADGLRSFCS
jgi:hypothetical protein